MILTVQRHVHDAVAGAIRRQFGVAEVPAFAVEVPPNRALGDLAVAVAFQLARTLRKPPRAIAQELAQRARPDSRRARVVAAPNGYLNLYLDRAAFLARARPRPRVVARDRRRPRRPSSSTRRSTRTRRRTSAICATPRSATRSSARCAFRGTPVEVAELHRRHRRAGRRRHRRLPRAGAEERRRGAAARRHRRDSTTTAGICTHASPNGTTATRRGWRCAPRRCTISSTAPATRPPSARSSSIGSCARICRRWRG